MSASHWKLSSIIVADDEVFAQLMVVTLESMGFGRIDIVPDLARLRERQTYQRHDLIVADGELRSDDCSDVLLAAKTDPLLPPAFFVVVSRDGLTLVTTVDRAADLKTLVESLPPHVRDRP